MIFIIYTLWYWLVILVVVPLHFFLALFSFLTPHPQISHRKLARFFIRVIAFNMRLHVMVQGAHHIPANESCIIMSNHASLIDILVAIIATPKHFNFIAKKELFFVPFIGLNLFLEGDFFIDRTNPRKAKQCLNRVEKKLTSKGSVLVFPEGTRSLNGEILPFKRGPFKLAATSGATIIPCYIHGSARIVRKKSLLAQPGTVSVTFLPPIPAPISTKKPVIDACLTDVHSAILSAKRNHTHT